MPDGSPSTALLVGVDTLVIPDGFDANGRLRLCVCLTPSLCQSDKSIDLSDWPAQVTKILASLPDGGLALGQVDATDKNNPVIKQVRAGIKFGKPPPHPAAADASALWKRIFATDGQAVSQGFQSLYTALQNGYTPASHPPPQGGAAANRQPLYASYQPQALADVIHNLYTASTAQAIVRNSARRALAKTKQPIPPALSHQQDGVGVKWWSALHRDWLNTVGYDDPVARLTKLSEQLAVRTARDQALGQMVERGALHAAGKTADLKTKLADAQSASRSNIAPLASFFSDKVGDLTYWRSNTPHPATTSHFRTEVAHMQLGRGMAPASAPVPRAAAPCPDPSAIECAARKFAAILSYPTLAKYLCLHFDITIDVSVFGAGRSYGAFAFSLGQPPSDSTAQNYLWTACVYQPARPGFAAYFGPCPQGESAANPPDSRQTYIDGVLNLNCQTKNNQPRFSLETLDTEIALQELAALAQQATQAERNGTASVASSVLPDPKSRGIRLLDAEPQSQPDSGIPSPQACTAGWHVRFLEDLIAGYRIDVAISDDTKTPPNDWPDSTRWRCLTAREVNYPDAALQAYQQNPDVQSVSYREDGHVRAMTGTFVTQSPGSDPNQTTIDNPTLFTWTGESLGLPGVPDPRPPGQTLAGSVPCAPVAYGGDGTMVYPDPNKDLAVSISFDLPSKGNRRPAPLREQRSYVFGARLYLTHGCGIKLDAAVGLYSQKCGVALGKDESTPFSYLRRSRIAAPDILLDGESPMANGAKPTEWQGEALTRLVIRSYADQPLGHPTTGRYITPPRAHFEQLEQAGEFDEVKDPIPNGAFSAKVGADLFPATGAFPIATDKGIEFEGDMTPDQRSKAKSRGPVFVLKRKPAVPVRRYYVDPVVRQVRARFAHNADGVKHYGKLSKPRPFWGPNDGQDAALPIMLELKPLDGGDASIFAAFDEKDATIGMVPRGGRQRRSLRKLSVALRKGQSVTLDLWAAPDTDDYAGHHYIQQALAALNGNEAAIVAKIQAELGDKAPPDMLAELNSMLGALTKTGDKRQVAVFAETILDGPLAPIMAKRQVELIHAVDKPLLEPGFAGFHPVVIAGAPGSIGAAWQAYVVQMGAADPLHWPSQTGGATTFFVGAVNLDRPTSGKVRCEALWDDWGPDTVVQTADDQWARTPSPSGAKLFEIDSIAYRGDNIRGSAVDLKSGDAGSGLRGLFYAFKDGRARLVKTQLIATSRFTQYFKGVGDDATICERPSLPDLHDPAAPATWVPCTFLPPPPDIDRILSLFHWGKNEREDGQTRTLTWTRTVSLRLFLKEGWYASGQGERLGLVCGSESAVVEDEYRDYVTRRAADPTHLSGTSGHQAVATPEISGPTLTKFSSVVPPIVTKDVIDPPQFDVVTFEPQFDSSQGLYCDIAIDPASAYWPFVALSLVRFQEHAVQSLRMSHALVKWAQIPPARQGTVTRNKRTQTVEWDYSGVGFHGANLGPAGTANTPLLRVRLMRAFADNGFPYEELRHNWRPVLDDNGQPMEWSLPPLDANASPMHWHGSFKLPSKEHGQDFGLAFEEYEVMWQDDICSYEAGSNGRTGKLVERGPLCQVIHKV